MTPHIINNNTILATNKSLTTCTTAFYNSSMLLNKHLYFSKSKNILAFIWTLMSHDNKLRFIIETEPRQLWKFQPSEPFVLPAGSGYRMNVVITHAVKARKLITDIHGPQFTKFNRVIAKDGSCGRCVLAPL